MSDKKPLTIKDIIKTVIFIFLIFLFYAFMPNVILKDVGISRNLWGWIMGIILILGLVVLFLQLFMLMFQDKLGNVSRDHPLESNQKSQSSYMGKPCSNCDKAMKWVEQYDRWYCENCQKYY